MFSSVKTDLQHAGDKWTMGFIWKNDYIPHDFSECGEAVLRMEAFDKTGKSVLRFEERVNLKSVLSKNPVAHFQEGVKGHAFIYQDPPITHSASTSKDLSGGFIHVTGWVKPQYWSKDEELEQVHFEEIKIPLK